MLDVLNQENEVNSGELDRIVEILEIESLIGKLRISHHEKQVLLNLSKNNRIKKSLIEDLDKINYLGRVITYLLFNKYVIVKKIKQSNVCSFSINIKTKIKNVEDVQKTIEKILGEYFVFEFFYDGAWSNKIINIRIIKTK